MTFDEAYNYIVAVSNSLPENDKVAEFVNAIKAIAEEVKKLKETP